MAAKVGLLCEIPRCEELPIREKNSKQAQLDAALHTKPALVTRIHYLNKGRAFVRKRAQALIRSCEPRS